MSENTNRHRLPRKQFDRTVVFGNTASGKSWLSRQLGDALSCVVVDLDQIRWVDGDYSRKQTTPKAIAATVERAKGDQWIIEGVYGWLARPIMDRATCLIWTDISWAESRKNLFARETARGSSGNFAELETWSSEYWSRSSDSSYRAHLSIYDAFDGLKYRLKNMGETSKFTDRIEP